jgi:hypothetical protein
MIMPETVAGGVYKDAEGDGYHDAQGNPVDKATIEEHLKLAKEHTDTITEAYKPLTPQDSESLLNALKGLVASSPQGSKPSSTAKTS